MAGCSPWGAARDRETNKSRVGCGSEKEGRERSTGEFVWHTPKRHGVDHAPREAGRLHVFMDLSAPNPTATHQNLIIFGRALAARKSSKASDADT